MREGDIILTPIPQADGAIKNRPAVFLREMPPFRDMLVCGISTQLHQQVRGFDETISPADQPEQLDARLHLQRFDETISPADADFATSGLLADSLIRLGFLTVLPRRRVVGSIGSLSRERHERLLRTLSAHLTANLTRQIP